MKKTLKKLLVCILILLIINNFFISNISFAASGPEEWLADMLGTVVGLLTWPIRLVAIGCGMAIEAVTKEVAYSQGSVDANGNIVPGTFLNDGMITPFDIFFNKIALIDVNFFNILNDGTIISNIRNSIAGWYYVMRMIAAAILLCVLIYVGIRMAISTIASDKAAYKKMLVDWVCSLALIFLLQYIILFTFSVNEAFIKALSGINDGKALSDAMVNIRDMSMGASTNAIAATIVFCMLVAQTLALLISYFNRMLKIAFLIIIAPLITLTYSIDKMGDGKAQALGTWLKEFVYTVLLQTFHCIIYMAFISMALAIFTSGASERNNLAGAVLAVLCVKFTKEGEKILGKIFKFSDSTSESSLAVGMAASAMALSKAKSIGKGTRSAVNGIRNLNIKGQFRSAATTAVAMKAMMFGGKDEEGHRISIDSKEEAIDYANARMAEKDAAKAEKKNNRGKEKYRVDSQSTEYQEKLQEKTAQLMKDTGMTERLAKATARKDMAAETRARRKQAKSDDFNQKHRILGGARGFVSKVGQAGSILKESETAKVVKDMAQASISAGVGTFAGSATYGVTGNAFNSIALGMASYKGTQEFFKSSTGTLVDTSQKLCSGVLGAKNSAQVENEMKITQAMAPILGDNQELQRQLDELLKFVEEALGKGSDAADDAKSTIRNTVSKNLKENPAISMADLMDKVKGDLGKREALQGITTKDGETMEQFMGRSEFNSGVTNASKLLARKELFDTMQTAGNLGLSADALTRMTSKSFKGDNSGSDIRLNSEMGYQSTDEIVSGVTGEDGKALTDVDAQKIAGERTEAGLGELRQELQKERDALEKQINKMQDGAERQALEEESDRLYESMRVLDAEQKKKIDEALRGYEQQYDQALQVLREDLSNMATADAQRKFDIEVAKMRQEVEAYRSRLEMHFGKEHKVGVYDRHFVGTMDKLKSSGDIES